MWTNRIFVVGAAREPPLLKPDDERGPPIQAPRFLARVVVFGPLLAVADRLEPIGGDAAADQVILHGGGAPIAEREVVLGRPDVARVPLDREPQRRRLAHRR